MTNPLHIDIDCSNNQISVRPLSDQDATARQAEQATFAQAAIAKEQALRTLMAPIRAYASNPAPSTEALHAAVRTLIRHLGLA